MRPTERVDRGSKDNATAFASRGANTNLRHVVTRLDASFSAAAIKLFQPYESPDNVVITDGNLAIDATTEKFKTTQTIRAIVNGTAMEKAAETAIVFSAAHVVSASKFGVILIQMDSTGVVSTKVPSATQAYTSAALALAALPSADTGNVAIGYIAIAAKAATWTANTDDLTDGSDLTTAAFTDATEVTPTLRWEGYVHNQREVVMGEGGLRCIDANRAIYAVLAASGTGGVLGKINLSSYTE